MEQVNIYFVTETNEDHMLYVGIATSEEKFLEMLNAHLLEEEDVYNTQIVPNDKGWYDVIEYYTSKPDTLYVSYSVDITSNPFELNKIYDFSLLGL